jgi:hypothetical protein
MIYCRTNDTARGEKTPHHHAYRRATDRNATGAAEGGTGLQSDIP